MEIQIDSSTHAPVGGDFVNIFDHEDYIAMVNAQDEASLVLKAHLILEEFLNVWAAKITHTQDLFAGPFIPFRTKLVICQNLGLSPDFFDLLDMFNRLRNKYSHRRKFQVEISAIDAMREKVDALPSSEPFGLCSEFEIWLNGKDAQGARSAVSYTWNSSDNKKKLVLVFVILVLKFVGWMQEQFRSRNIQYNIIASANQA